MLIIPAIDIFEGRVVRLSRGDYDRVTDYGSDPPEFFRRWAEAGARRIHLVFLGAARSGRRTADDDRVLRLLLEEKKKLGVEVQVGGGLREITDIEKVLEWGADFIITGTAAVREMAGILEGKTGPGRLLEDIERKKLTRRLIMGIDTRQGLAAVNGWEKTVRFTPDDIMGGFVRLGFQRFACTATSRDGTLAGPDTDSIRKLAARFPGASLIAAGGIGRLADIERLAELNLPGLEGVITGKAVYEGRLDLGEAIKHFQENKK